MKQFLAALLASVLFFSQSGLAAEKWTTPSPKPVEVKVSEEQYRVRWEGELDFDLMKQVRGDIAYAKEQKKKVLVVDFLSPGGSVIWSMEIARQIILAQQDGLIVEIRGYGLIASGGTFVLASGTKGRRYISEYALFLVHPPQAAGFLSRECLTFTDKPENENQKMVNAVLIAMRNLYMQFTGKSREEVEKWLTCGNEQVGLGQLAVELGMADEIKE